MDFVYFDPPAVGAPVPLALTPRLESWDSKHARSQVELAAYLDHVETLLSYRLHRVDGPAGHRAHQG